MADIKKKLVDGAGLQAAMGIMADFADKGVRGSIGGYNQSFPLTAATKGNIYYHKGTNRYYICVDNYNGSSLTNPNSKFEELSVYTNRQRLDNLSKVHVDDNKYKVSSTIPYWSNYKFHIVDIAITNMKNFGVSDMLITVSGASRIVYNDNNLSTGSYSITIDATGKITTSGNSSCVQQSYVMNIYMFN